MPKGHAPRLIFWVAVLLFALAAALSLFYYLSPRATLRITTGPATSPSQRAISTFIHVVSGTHPFLRVEEVPVADLAASSKALEDRKVNLAIVRTDVAAPSNGQTIAILRRDVVAIVLPHGSPIKDAAGLARKTIAVPEGALQTENQHALDEILAYFDVPAASVRRLVLPLAEIGPALRVGRAAAALAVGPIGPGQAVDVVASIAKAMKSPPQLLAMDQADALVKRFPGFESVDIPEGAFKAHPPVPDDTVKGLAVTYRLVAPFSMLNVVAGAIGRSIFKTKAKLAALSPGGAQIEAPDLDSQNPLLPVHPGVAAYLASGDQSFFDSLQQYFYIIGIPLSLLGSLVAVLLGLWNNRRLVQDQNRVFRLLTLADEALTADSAGLERIETEFRALVAECVNKLADGETAADQYPVSSLAIDHARRSIEWRKTQLRATPEALQSTRIA
ncbi:TAXI family TRAP transporter solute-binding subunit [Methylosinus sp. PW1]|uniref:TAXI family TRAP transporter solute-binding subunit n=1 Tax=Methylosinus sp. PW1 TaxID=107636 RepID=UPI00068AE61C|nr:TAXI family TRAP transporter solute-binding subunit [Methylosinus sp. PW1]